MKQTHWVVISIVGGLLLVSGAGYVATHVAPQPLPQPSAIEVAQNPVQTPETSLESQNEQNTPHINCDDSLWAHVYSGDTRKFKSPQDRLKVITPCVSVTGVIVTAVAEADGDWHVRLDVDSEYKSMLNDKNMSGQHGYLVLEPVCENPVTQKDTIQEKSCDNFKQNIFDKSLIGKRVRVIGVYVEDEEHLWNEIHPVTSIQEL